MMRPRDVFVASFSTPPDGPCAEIPVSRLASLGLPVPAGFLVLEPPGVSRSPSDSSDPSDRTDPGTRRFVKSIDHALGLLERRTGRTVGDAHAPLFLRLVDTSAPDRPGSDLPLGLGPSTLEGLIRMTGQPRFALDCLRRLIALIGCQVHGLDRSLFDRLLEREQSRQGGDFVDGFPGISLEGLRELVARSLDLFEAHTATPFDGDPRRQLLLSMGSLWKRAPAQHPAQHTEPLLVQAMVFGNSGGRSGAGLLCTRDPASGEDRSQIDFLVNARPSELPTGRRLVRSAAELSHWLPGVSEQLERARPGLERAFGDMLEVEFVVEDGQLWFLWARPGQRSARASLRVATDLVSAGQISRLAALRLLDGVPPEQLPGDRVVAGERAEPLLVGLPTSPGAGAGRLALCSERARVYHQSGSEVILLCEHRTTANLFGLAVSRGVLLLSGGRSSLAAVMARRLGLPCVMTRGQLSVDRSAALIRFGEEVVREGDPLTIDGYTGNVYAGRLPLERAPEPEELSHVRHWIHEAELLNHPLR